MMPLKQKEPRRYRPAALKDCPTRPRLEQGRDGELEHLRPIVGRLVQDVSKVATERAERRVPDQRRTDRSAPGLIVAGGRKCTRIARKIGAVDPGRVGPDGTAQAIVLRQAGDRELDLAGNTGIHGRAKEFAARQAWAKAPALKAADQLRTRRESL